MFGKKVFAAMLATVLGASLFGANAANAQINLDSDMGGVTYATETLVAATASDLTGYSLVTGGADTLDVTAEVGLAGPSGSFVTIRFDLSGMVFGNTPPTLGFDGGHGTASRRDGGDAGEAFVSFIAPRTDANAADDVATLNVTDFGVKPGVDGSVMMTVTDSLGDGAESTASYTNAVRTMRALQETPDPKNLLATVEERFMSFGPVSGTVGTIGTLGSFEVGTNETFLSAVDGGAVVDADIYANGQSSVTISGDFSFASMAWLQAAAVCDTTGATNLRQVDGETVMDELTAQMPDDFADPQYLCISVPTVDAMAIPETAPYMVTTKYAGGIENAGWPANDGEHALGRITRDGTTVHIPFLTTWADYNQRIVVSNRSANEVPYWITFRPEEGVTATPNDMYAMGTLDGNSTIVLRAMDVVTLEGRTRTAATFVAEAQRTQIDVATVIVNMMTGSTDTVNYDPEP